MKSVLPLLALAALLGMLATPARSDDLLRDPVLVLAKANNAFGWGGLYGALREGDDNLFFSPYSVHAALTMTRAGAEGATAAEMDTVLHLPRIPRDRGYPGLRRALVAPTVQDGWGKDAQKVPGHTLRVANALWGQAGFRFEPRFLTELKDDFGAPLESIDFADSAGARKRINDWVAQQTREKIKDIVPPGLPPPLTRLVLANAIYFKAQWADPFRERWTKEGDFTRSKSETSKAQFMHRVGRYAYGEIDGVQVVEFPYRSRATSMVVFLPREAAGLGVLETKLCAGTLKGWEKLGSRLVDLKLPRWKFTTTKDLTSTLPTMGMPLAFDPQRADFSGMTTQEKLHIGLVLHKAFVAVDENGTEAAAATIVTMKAGSAPAPEQKVAFVADHPFVFVIRHRATGAILFSGRVTKP